jgi:hypothetical protein
MSNTHNYDVKFVDRDFKPLAVGQVVRYNIKGINNNEEIQGWAKVIDLDTEVASLLPWLEESAAYANDTPSQWPLFWDEEKRCYVASGTSQNATFSLGIEESLAFDAPVEYWPDLLSLLATSFINDERLKFSIRGSVLDTVQVSDPNGFLPAFAYLADVTRSKIFPDSESALVFYHNEKSIANMSFVFDDEKSPRQNSLYYHTHFLLDALINTVNAAKKNPEFIETGLIPLDEIVSDWLVACEKKKVLVLPYRPVLKSVKGERATPVAATGPQNQGARGGRL